MAPPSQPDHRVPVEEADPTEKMSFFDHLEELRRRIFYSMAAIGIGLCIGLYFSVGAFDFLAHPMLQALREAGLGDKMIFTHPLGAIRLYLTVGLYLGIVIASPLVLHQVWLFVAPGLYRHERRAAVSFLLSAIFLFLAGTAFGYVVALPIMLKFLISFQGPFTPMISINDYFDLVLVILLGLGLLFQLPILIFFLSLFGIVTPRFLWNNFRYAVLIIAVIAAVVTPTTDVLTMVVFMAPMIVLYVIGIGVSFLVIRKKDIAAGRRTEGSAVAAVVTVIVIGASLAALVWVGNHFGWWSVLR